MKLILQRVNSASVEVNKKIIGKINKGITIFLGISKDYNEKKLDWMINKILKLKLWGDETSPNFKKNIEQIKGEILIISQFTLHGTVTSGTKPNFNNSMPGNQAKEIYKLFIKKLGEKTNLKIQTGKFGEYMKITQENDGPITIILKK